MEFNCIIVGGKESGKSAYLKRFITGDFSENYNPTLEENIYHLTFKTNIGNVKFNIFENYFPSIKEFKERQQHIEEGTRRYLPNSLQNLIIEYDRSFKGTMNCAIIMIDLTKPHCTSNIKNYYDILYSKYGNDISIIVCGNKCDRASTNPPKGIRKLMNEDENMIYLPISARSNYNYEKPWFYLIIKLLDDNIKTRADILTSNIQLINYW